MRPHRLCLTAMLAIATTLTLAPAAGAATYEFGGHTVTSDEEIRICNPAASVCTVWLPQGWRLGVHEPYGVASWSKQHPWGPALDVTAEPPGGPDRCATTYVRDYGIVGTTSTGCYRSVRWAKAASRKLSRGVKRGRGWRCRAGRSTAICKIRGRRLRIASMTRDELAAEREAREHRMTRCGKAHKIGEVTVWARGFTCSDVIHLGVDQALRLGMGQSMVAPGGWKCQSVDDALACRPTLADCRDAGMIVFQRPTPDWPGMRVSQDAHGAVWHLRSEPAC